jgi:hypothetical protein
MSVRSATGTAKMAQMLGIFGRHGIPGLGSTAFAVADRL